MSSSRPSWDVFYLGLAKYVAQRSTCLTRQVGMVLVKDKRILATGYNGTPSGFCHCDMGGCQRCADRMTGKVKTGGGYDVCRCVHSECNLAAQCCLHGVSPEGGTVYCRYLPCAYCSLLLVSMKIKRYVYTENADSDSMQQGFNILLEAGVENNLIDIDASRRLPLASSSQFV